MTGTHVDASGADRQVASDRRGRLAALTFGPLRPPTLTGPWRAVLIVGLIVVGTLLSLARTPLGLWDVLWAEDGAIFLSQALSRGPDVLFQGYAGYMHLVPRLAAELTVLLPISVVPVAVTIIAALLTSLTACACFVFMETRLASVPLRFAAWLACLVLPIMGGEVVNNLANLHWFLLVAAFCATLVRSRSYPFAVLQGVAVFAAVASDALALLLLPFLVYRWFVYGARRDRIPTLAFVLAAALQIAVVVSQMLTGGRPIGSGRPTAVEFFELYAVRVALGSLTGVRGTVRLVEGVGPSLPWITLALITAALVAACWLDRDRRVGIAAFAISSLVFAGIVHSLQWEALAPVPLLDLFTGGRYAVVPVSLLLLAMLQAADAFLVHVQRDRLRKGIALALAVAVLIPVAVDLRSRSVREGTADWTDAIEQAEIDCDLPDNPANGVVTVMVAPAGFSGMLMPCAVLEGPAED
ncbi:hypothetical protein ACLQ2Q_01260 [Microbacterium sp. DT81.1]|uniref:hypothetical protein n=1 Tax=Microbacterium sp. DT81.1 TaxID=3393413 RepID=UPI003CF9C3B1